MQSLCGLQGFCVKIFRTVVWKLPDSCLEVTGQLSGSVSIRVAGSLKEMLFPNPQWWIYDRLQ